MSGRKTVLIGEEAFRVEAEGNRVSIDAQDAAKALAIVEGRAPIVVTVASARYRIRDVIIGRDDGSLRLVLEAWC